MSTIYIETDHGLLKKKNDILHLIDADKKETSLFPHQIERIVLSGNIEITAQAFKLIMKHKIPVSYITKRGDYKGRLVFDDGKNVFLRKNQYDLLTNESFKIQLVRNIIEGKLKNQLALMQRINRNSKQLENFKPVIRQMKEDLTSLDKMTSIDQLRGLEGLGAKLYFSMFKYNLIPSWAEFNGRSKHPPKDNVNAVLSYLYTILFTRIDSMLASVGLDPYVGYLHTLEYGRKSLAFDIMEEFRTPIVDTTMFSLFNLGILSEHNFRGDKYEGVLLTKEGVILVIAQFEKKLESEHKYSSLNKKLRYKDILFEQVKLFHRIIINPELEYKPVVFR